MNKQPAKLVSQCLRVIEQWELEPRDRYTLYAARWNQAFGINILSDEFWMNFITRLTNKEMVDLGLDSKQKEELIGTFIDSGIQIKFKKSVHGPYGTWTNRDRMKMKNVDMMNYEWFFKQILEIEYGIIEFTAPKSGKYRIIQQSRSTNPKFGGKPSFGVNLELKIVLKKGEKLQIFIADTVFLFDKNQRLISVPGAAGIGGTGYNNGSMTTELQYSGEFDQIHGNGGGQGNWNCSGYKRGTGSTMQLGANYQGGSTFVDRNYW